MGNYERAGIFDVADFYKNRFVEPESYVQGFLQENTLNRLSISTGKLMWMSHNIRPGSKVLDFGCGSGAFGFLVDKDCEIYGVELSDDARAIAKASGYKDVFVGLLQQCDFERQSFDFVLSLDVLGHIEFDDKDGLIEELKSFLKPSGVMVHGIEAGDVNYDVMTTDEIREFVGVDGHVGVEHGSKIRKRFERLFGHVLGRTGFDRHQSRYDMLKHWQGYGHQIDRDLAIYLQTMDANEIFAFDLATGIVNPAFQSPSPDESLDDGGFMLIVASDVPTEWCAYMNEESTQARVWPWRDVEPLAPGMTLDLNHPAFMRGWYPPEPFAEGLCRWAPSTSWLVLSLAPTAKRLVATLRPAISEGTVEVVCSLEGRGSIVARLTLDAGKWTECEIPLSHQSRSPLLLRLWCGRPIIPAYEESSVDVRELALVTKGLRIE